jgi:nitronate monooxygenase
MIAALFPGPHPLALPLIGAPMFIASGPELVIAQCRSGVVGTMPSLSVRRAEDLDAALSLIGAALAAHGRAHAERPAAPYGINLIAHKTNLRLEHDLAVCVAHRVPLIITSLGPSRRIVEAVHGYGGTVFHDVTNLRHARKAIDEGVDGLVAVAAGAGGHGGTLSPFALLAEIRRHFDGYVALAGAMSSGAHVAAAIAMGADFAYLGTRFLATQEAAVTDEYKAMVVASRAADIVYTPFFTGVHGNYLRASIVRAGLDPDHLPVRDADSLDYSSGRSRAKAWRDVWGAGQGVGSIDDVPTVADLVARMTTEFAEAARRLGGRAAAGLPIGGRRDPGAGATRRASGRTDARSE